MSASSSDTKKKSGLTIIEFVLLVGILLVLAAIVVVATRFSQERTRDTQREADMETLRIYQEQCREEVGCGGGAGLFATNQEALLTSGLIDNQLEDPSTGVAYHASGAAPGEFEASTKFPPTWSACVNLEAKEGAILCSQEGCFFEEGEGVCRVENEIPQP